MHEATSLELKGDLVVANRVLSDLGVLDAFGHVSVRSDADSNRYVLTRLLAPELVTMEDLIEYDLESRPVGAEERRQCLERFIHGEIYKNRPDVQAIVHSHSPSVIPFTASSTRLRPIYHMGAFIGKAAPVFDIREKFGATDLLVRDPEHGRSLAQVIGKGALALMRGHGFATVGENLAVAVYRAFYTEVSAKAQREAIALGGEITYLSEGEAERADAVLRSVVEKPWTLWKRRALEKLRQERKE